MSSINYKEWDYDPLSEVKYCLSCDGSGYIPICDMCGGKVDEDTLLCFGCHEHSSLSECESCDGHGVKDLDYEEMVELIADRKADEADRLYDEMRER